MCAVEYLILVLIEKGYCFVTVSELAECSGNKLEKDAAYDNNSIRVLRSFIDKKRKDVTVICNERGEMKWMQCKIF